MPETQFTYSECINALNTLSDNAQRIVLDMLMEAQDAENRHKPTRILDPDAGDELYSCALVNENPYPLEEVLSDLPKPLLLALIPHFRGPNKPDKTASETEIVQWLVRYSCGLDHELPPFESFTFVPEFDAAQPAVYEYLCGKYGNA